MSEYSAVIFDVDGTLVEPTIDAAPTDRVANAVRELKDHPQVELRSLATGRPLWMTRGVMDRMGIDQLCVLNGGAEIYSPDRDEVIYKKKIPILSQRAVVAICHALDIDVYDANNQVLGSPIPDLGAVDEDNVKLFISGLEAEQSGELAERIRAVDGLIPLESTSWLGGPGSKDMHITTLDATKEQAVKAVLNAYDIDPEKAIGIGDSEIDIPLFVVVGLGLAMGNASIDVQNVADNVIPPLERDGVAHFLELTFGNLPNKKTFEVPVFRQQKNLNRSQVVINL